MYDLLKGVKILDLTTVLLGPYATQFLGDLGADVIKVEPPEGDGLRYADAGQSPGMSAAYLNCNRNKRSVVLDLKEEHGYRALGRLVESADVFVHNMQPKTARKLGIGRDDISRIKSDIVYCYACGFGQEGRLANEPAYDEVVQALSGLAFLNKGPDDEPRYLPNAICDKIGGLHLAIAILAGLASRKRTGEGVCIETPMFESMVSFLFVELLGGRSFDPPLGPTGYRRLSTPFRRPFRTRDGYVSILPYNTSHWRRFLGIIGRADLADDENVICPSLRSRNIESLYKLIAEVAPGRTSSEWLHVLREQEIPCAEVNRPEALLEDPHLADAGLFRRPGIRSPFGISDAERQPERPPPALGADGEAILREAGYTDADIDALAGSGALHLPG